jgi:hypothetical protein
MIQLGNVLVNAPEEPDGLWIHLVIAEALNGEKRSDLRDGYSAGIYNSRGVQSERGTSDAFYCPSACDYYTTF